MIEIRGKELKYVKISKTIIFRYRLTVFDIGQPLNHRAVPEVKTDIDVKKRLLKFEVTMAPCWQEMLSDLGLVTRKLEGESESNHM